MKRWVNDREKKVEEGNTEIEKKLFAKLLKKQKKKRGRQQRKSAPLKSAQSRLRYSKMFENGLCEIAQGYYSKSIQFSDVNYQIAQSEDQMNIFRAYCELLNSCDDHVHLSLTLLKKRIAMTEFEKQLFYEETGESQDQYRRELNGMLNQTIQEGKNNFIKRNYLTFSVQATDFDQAKHALNRMKQNLMESFSEIDSQCSEMNGIERLELLHELLKPDDFFYFKYTDLVYSRLSTKTAVTPTSFNFKNKNYFEIGTEYGQVIYLKDYPATVSDKLILELMEIAEELTLSIHIDPVAPEKANRLVQNKKAYMEGDKTTAERKATQKGYDPYTSVPYELTNSIAEAEALLDDLVKSGHKLFFVTILVYFRAKSKQKLEDIAEQVRHVGRKHRCGFNTLDYMQDEGLNSVLPLGKNWVEIKRTLTTESTAIFLPFSAQDLNHEDGKYYGMNETTKNVVKINRKKLNTPSGMILGSSGSGKGVAKKYEEITTLLKNPHDEIISIDPEDEDTVIGQAFDAQIIKIAPNTDTFINLLDISEDLRSEIDPIKLKSDFLLTACEALIGGQTGLSSAQRSIIDRVTRLTYFNHQQTPEKPIPTLSGEWFPLLKEQPEKEAQSLALDLELYIEGSLSIFSKSTNVALNKRFVIYNTKQLGNQLKTFGMMVVLEQVWNRVVRNRERGITTWIYIDEMQLMLNDPYCENYFFELWSRIRKWGAIATGITQNVETLLLSDKARRMLSNTEFLIMLKQAKSDLDELAVLFNLSSQQQKQLLNPIKGAGLIRAGNAIVPFSNTVDPTTKLYELMTTDPAERTKLRQGNPYGN
ncbi:hypothetical protein A5844_001954 [Enterococcus sp. 10A9_DIV0425]|uniref:TraG P-loop domain-containing protein n=1 Tax=Candidatus Enterococcus wittei TaxID=1987383 RepID=A0A242JY63_9ENTE|nr:hypothetical protein [Enterococcus sp. 10A9_DIV0425]OTP10255.1 hypothetical protein A5844_001954 [Enterococcus sp. 10A9_DIV0425]THE10225.1 hypothetical protein E1H99_09845 [Enterococcus hirae]